MCNYSYTILKNYTIMKYLNYTIMKYILKAILHPIKFCQFKYLQNKDIFDMTKKDYKKYDLLYTFFRR